ncbi:MULTISPECIES: hypothetical protein [unclassified Nocardiopsis]|uniref:hypothetical protein n=1 Tax=Nocardiopsis TaxID=2013 RepID=UPI00387A904D
MGFFAKSTGSQPSDGGEALRRLIEEMRKPRRRLGEEFTLGSADGGIYTARQVFPRHNTWELVAPDGRTARMETTNEVRVWQVLRDLVTGARRITDDGQIVGEE